MLIAETRIGDAVIRLDKADRLEASYPYDVSVSHGTGISHKPSDKWAEALEDYCMTVRTTLMLWRK